MIGERDRGVPSCLVSSEWGKAMKLCPFFIYLDKNMRAEIVIQVKEVFFIPPTKAI